MRTNFRWSITTEEATIFIEGNDKYVPSEFKFEDTKDSIKNRQGILRHYQSYNWERWIEDAVHIGITGVSEELKRYIAEGKHEELDPEDMITAYEPILEVIKSNCICYDHSGNTFDFDEEIIEWLQTQIKKLKRMANTNILIAKMRWEEQMIELTKG